LRETNHYSSKRRENLEVIEKLVSKVYYVIIML